MSETLDETTDPTERKMSVQEKNAADQEKNEPVAIERDAAFALLELSRLGQAAKTHASASSPETNVGAHAAQKRKSAPDYEDEKGSKRSRGNQRRGNRR